VSGQSSGKSSQNPVDRWIHTLKSRRSLTRIPIMEFGDLNDKESWICCILKLPNTETPGGSIPLNQERLTAIDLPLEGKIFHSLALSGFDISLIHCFGVCRVERLDVLVALSCEVKGDVVFFDLWS
jgi:hypothetical protein